MDRQVYHIRVAAMAVRCGTSGSPDSASRIFDNGEAILSGSLPDQAALHGVLSRLRDLGVPLLTVQLAAPEDGA